MAEKPAARAHSLEILHDTSITLRYFAPLGHTLEMCQAPDYWRDLTREVSQQRMVGKHAWNKIEIIAEDGTWEAELRVVSVSGLTVKTRLLREWREPASKGKQADLPDGYQVEFIPKNGWRALDHNGKVVTAAQATKEEAVRAAFEHNKKAAA